ncbi:NAD+ synthase [Sulfurimonas sp. MAG313]|nr:NAD+ synthase [Sulfurimonas sp. MAG313]MDF1879803.1 NAD+ synthase [Sulfurimonas sp. MAG313]
MSKYQQISQYLIAFLKEEVTKTGLENVVIGLSGGLDSAVVAVLAHKAFGDKLLSIKMPSQFSSQNSLDDADELCKKFKLKSETRDISKLLKAYGIEDMSSLRIGNLSSRLRMMNLFDISARQSALVLGTSNKSELMLGYGTLYGDLASAINPIGDLYKTEVFELAKYLEIPSSIIDKPPSADLWEGQSDEDELGYSYAELDAVLKRYVDERAKKEELLDEGFDAKLVEMILKKIYFNQFKRKMPLIAKLTNRSVNHDFNYPRDIGL